MTLCCLFGLVGGCFALLVVCFFVARFWASRRRIANSVAFFHPYCNAGGGGERVLWCAIRAVQRRHPNHKCYVYTGDGAALAEILELAERRFNVGLDGSKVELVRLSCRRLVEAELYPVCTMLCQSLAGLALAGEALLKLVPEVFVDSMGYPASLPLFRYVAGSKTGTYVHYPVISTDMLGKVKDGVADFNNRPIFANVSCLRALKLVYYRMFASFYGFLGSASLVTAVNGSWTKGHIDSLWGCDSAVVHPPCNVDEFLRVRNRADEVLEVDKMATILSVGQFRPEKRHKLQIEALAELLELLEKEALGAKLILLGSCRHEQDQKRVDELGEHARLLDVEANVEFKLNVGFGELKAELSRALIGLHTMKDEHFGIGVVEGMAAGVVMVAHESGGPKLDIIGPNSRTTGFLAFDKRSYAETMYRVMLMKAEERREIRNSARLAVASFSDDCFEKKFLEAFSPLLF